LLKQPDYVLYKNVDIPMRDGVLLRGDLYKPADDTPRPVILVRLPYIKENMHYVFEQFNMQEFVERDYAVFIVDCRGNGHSQGANEPFIHEKEDGYDTVKWVHEQPWCNGRIAMMGQSYFSYTQLTAASMDPPGLVAIAPGEMDSKFLPTAPAGVFSLGTSARWYMDRVMDCTRHSDLPEEEKKRIIDMFTDFKMRRSELCWHIPLDEAPFAQIEGLPCDNFYLNWVNHIGDKDFWLKAGEQLGMSKIKVPTFIYTGWFDFCLRGSIEGFESLTHNSPNPELEPHHRLLVGPWGHYDFSDHAGDISFGPAANLQVEAQALYNWMDRWLKNDESVSTGAPVKIFVMGENVWRDEQEWPLARTQYKNLYLDGTGSCLLKDGGGRMSFDLPSGTEKDSYVYDPDHPFDSTGFCTERCGLRDRTAHVTRDDVAVFTTAPFEEDVEVTGDVKLKFWLGSSAPDTDFYFTLVDVHPDGKSYPLAEKMVRARYRNDPYEAEFLTPNEPAEFNVYIGSTSMLFAKGHSIRIEITSSDYPRYNRHLNTDEPIGSAKNMQTATQLIFHSEAYPSHIILPVIPR